jgi:nucleoside-diphosphate-sugar epimerase
MKEFGRRTGDIVTMVGSANHDPEFFLADLNDPIAVNRAVEGVDAVIHSAALIGGWGTSTTFLRSNYDTTRNVVEAAIRHNVKHFV